MITPEMMTEYEQNKVIYQYTKLNQELTSDIIKKISSHGDISSYTKSQIRQLARQGGTDIFYESLKKTNNISKNNLKLIQELFDEVSSTQLAGYKATYKARNKELVMTKSMQKLISTSYKRTNKTLKNLTKTVAFSSKKTYVKALDDLYRKVATGSMDYERAKKSTINELSEIGIKLQSKDKNGNIRHYSLEGMVKNNLMTSLTQTTNEMAEEIGDVIGANCVDIGHTPHCRPTHRVIDGVIMSIDKFKQYKELTEEPNCYHIVNYDWREEFEGKANKVSFNGHLTQKEYEKNYEIRQKQNYFARQVRDKKSKSVIVNNAENKKALRQAQIKYRQFCNSNKIPVDYSLTWKAGYNK